MKRSGKYILFLPEFRPIINFIALAGKGKSHIYCNDKETKNHRDGSE